MPPLGVHFFVGVGIVLLGKRFFKDSLAFRAFSWGILAGSVLCDSDLVLSCISFLVTGFDMGMSKFIHRTFTHSLITYFVLLCISWGLMERARQLNLPSREPFQEKFSLTRKLPSISTYEGSVFWGYFFTFLTMGLAVHMFLDMFYLVGVKLLFPVSFHEYFFADPVTVENIRKWTSDATASDTGADPVNNLINGIDFMTDSLIYLFLWKMARSLGITSKFVRALPIIAIVNLGIFGALTSIYAWGSTYDGFVIITYVPGIFFIVVTTLLIPIWLRNLEMELFLGTGKNIQKQNVIDSYLEEEKRKKESEA